MKLFFFKFTLIFFSMQTPSFAVDKPDKVIKANTKDNISKKKPNHLEREVLMVKNEIGELKLSLKKINSDIKENLNSSSMVDFKINSLTKKLDHVEEIIKQESKAMKFETFSAILLTAVAVIVTVLGVIIAILAFFGFKNIKLSAIEASVNMSEKKLEGAISSGRFDDSIDKAIAYVAYRDVMSESDLRDEEKEEEL